MNNQQGEQSDQIMRPRHSQACLDEKRFEVFFRGLLAVKTNNIVQGALSCTSLSAARKSASAFLTHSAVNRFIEDFSLGRDLS